MHRQKLPRPAQSQIVCRTGADTHAESWSKSVIAFIMRERKIRQDAVKVDLPECREPELTCGVTVIFQTRTSAR